jgi:hypothetical protein
MEKKFRTKDNKEGSKYATVPQPPTRLIMGNVYLIDKDVPSLSLLELSRQYGPIYKMQLGPKYRLPPF